MKKLGLIVAAAAMIATVSATVVSAKGWVQQGADWYYVDGSGEYVTDTIQASGTNKFYLGEDGRMEKDYFLEDKDNNTYYFGSNGAMVTNTWVAIDASIVENQGDYVPDTYWYYFQSSGKAMKSSTGNIKKTTIDGKKVAFNEYGQMLTGWITSDGKVVNPDDETNPFVQALYYAGGDNDGVLRSGWVTYYDGYDEASGWLEEKTNLYFYFNPTNNKKTGNADDGAKTKKINGKTYAFSDEGIMLSGWDATTEKSNPGIVADSLRDKITYFSGEDDGHQVKKGWVYAVPTAGMDTTAYEDSEEKYMYFGSSGDIVKNQFKKINGKYYAFNYAGIMKTGLVIWCADTYARKDATVSDALFVSTVDLDYAEGSDITKQGKLRTDSHKVCDVIWVDYEGKVIGWGGNISSTPKASASSLYKKEVKLHLFGDDGARKTGSNTVQFSDDSYTFQSTASGDKGFGAFSKKYYVMGILLKANQDIRYGIYNDATDSAMYAMQFEPQAAEGEEVWETDYADNLENGNYLVLTTSGSKQKGNKAAKKDADGNYWVIDNNEGYLNGIFTHNVKWQDSKEWSTKEYSKVNGPDANPTLRLNTTDCICKALDSASWVETSAGSGKYIKKIITADGYWFQSDYGDKANQWLPFGLLDNAKNTVTMKYSTITDPAAFKYMVKPNNDYFLNCYWIKP